MALALGLSRRLLASRLVQARFVEGGPRYVRSKEPEAEQELHKPKHEWFH